MEFYLFDFRNMSQKVFIQNISTEFSEDSIESSIVQTLVWEVWVEKCKDVKKEINEYR